MHSDLEVWITRLPRYELGSDGVDLGSAVFDHVHEHSYAVHPDCAAVVLREMVEVEKLTGGRVRARILKANSTSPWPQPPWRRRTKGTRISLMLSGTAWFHYEGVGEESFSAHDSWSIPDGLEHELLEASNDFELLEIEVRGAAGENLTAATTEMLMLYGSYSYRPIPQFGRSTPDIGETLPRLDTGAALSLNLHNHPPTGWAGCPWHLHDEGVQCGYLTTGSAQIDVEGVGLVEARAGTFWLQQANTPINRS